MSTDDSSVPTTPHELTGPLGQVGDPGGGIVPLLERVPAPSAIAGGSPGLSTGAATIPHGPTLPSDDPASLALLIGRMANQLFLGSTVAPVPMSPANALTAVMASSPLASPGIAPSLVPSAPGVPPAGIPSDVTATAHPGYAPTVEPHASLAPASGSPAPSAIAGNPAGSLPAAPSAPVPVPSIPYGASGSPFPTTITPAPGATPGPVGALPSFASPFASPFAAPSSPAPFGDASFDAPHAFAGSDFSVPLFEPVAPTPPQGTPSLPTTAPTPASYPRPQGAQLGTSHPSASPSASTSQATEAGAPSASSPSLPSSSQSLSSPFGASPSFGNLPGIGGPAVPSTPHGIPTPSSPFGTTSLPTAPPSSPQGGHLVPAPSAPTPSPSSPFGSSPFELPATNVGDGFDLPLVETTAINSQNAIDAAPSFTPDPEAVGLDTGTGRVEQSSSSSSPSLVRDLGRKPFDPYAVRRDFPILEERVHGNKRLVWLDNAATTQKPRAVIDRLTHFYEHENSNIHRAAHTLAARATDGYESARESVRRFINAPSAGEIIFVRGATEGINLVAKAWGRRNIGKGDKIIVTNLEHHANIVPWQQLCAETGARLRVAPVDDRGSVILEEYERLLCSRTKLVAFTQVSNALGSITPAREMVAIAKRYGAHVLVDGAQAVSHMRVDVQQLDCDFYVFSGHKVFAPTGIGAVFGKRAILEDMPPWQGGGNMISDVTFEKTTYHPPPFRFEAGTGNIADAVGLGAALDYVMRIGMDVIDRYEHELLVYATERLATVRGLRMIGTSPHKAGVLSFVLDGQRTEDVGGALDKDGIAVRSGHHCAQPILRRFGLEASVRASLAFYNITEDIDALVESLHRLQAGRRPGQ